MSSRNNTDVPTARGRIPIVPWVALLISLAFNVWAWERLSTKPAGAEAAPALEKTGSNDVASSSHSAAAKPQADAPVPIPEAAPPPEKPKSDMSDVIAAIENTTNRRKLTSLKFDETSLVYGEFFRAEKFDREILRQLRQKLAERAVSRTAVYAYGADLDQSDREAISAKYEAQFDAEIAGIIGAEEAAKLKEYERTQGARSITNRWNERVSYFAEPLTVQQRSTLTELLVSHPPPPYPTSQSPQTVAEFRERKLNFETELLKEATFLSEAQRSALAEAMAEDDVLETPEH